MCFAGIGFGERIRVGIVAGVGKDVARSRLRGPYLVGILGGARRHPNGGALSANADRDGSRERMAFGLTSSVGKKVAMALTGLVWYGFLVGHLLGNLQLLRDDGGAAFDAYAHLLESLGGLVIGTEIVLVAALAVHAYCGVSLSLEARRARPVGYRQLQAVGDRSLASRTMVWSGLVLLVFVVVHVSTFKYGQRVDGSLYRLVASTYAQPTWAAAYVVVMSLLGFHMWHALQSAFQTLGLAARPTLRRVSIVLCVAIAGGFALIPATMFLAG